MFCKYDHTDYQPLDEDWKCPRCGSGVEQFFCDATVNENCPKLHLDDEIVCNRCDVLWPGEELAKAMMGAGNLMTCPTCKGKGVVGKEKP